VGTYSSIFFATPLLVSLRERTEMVRTHTKRVLKRRNVSATAGESVGGAAEAADSVSLTKARTGTTTGTATGNKPQPGARVRRPSSTRAGRPTGKNSSTSR
jgi:preprotein translocase subunit SecF